MTCLADDHARCRSTARALEGKDDRVLAAETLDPEDGPTQSPVLELHLAIETGGLTPAMQDETRPRGLTVRESRPKGAVWYVLLTP